MLILLAIASILAILITSVILIIKCGWIAFKILLIGALILLVLGLIAIIGIII